MSFNQLHTQSTSPMDADGVVRCSHGETAIRRTSQTSSNPNRYVQNGLQVSVVDICRSVSSTLARGQSRARGVDSFVRVSPSARGSDSSEIAQIG